MAAKPKNHAESSDNFLEGKLLIALPGMPDPRFEKSVIFMCAHSGDGAMGIIINKKVEGLAFRDMMKKLEIRVGAGTPNAPVLFGGPVQTGRGFVLHSGEFEGNDSTLSVTDDISLTATLDVLRAIAQGNGPHKSLFALGYAGWDGGQIENEIRANGWVHCDADNALVFDSDLDSKWSGALKKLGIDASGLSALTGRA
ncbi:MAG TPA: YqgE/AlgH family protein [Rhizomicrobium sp.]